MAVARETARDAASTRVHIRWLIRRDMPEVLAAEVAGRGDLAWGEETFLRTLRLKNVIGMVAETRDGRVVGHMVYELHRDRLHLARFTVHPAWGRQGVGRQLIAKLKGKLDSIRRDAITVVAPEVDGYAGPRFLKACGFVATGVFRDAYGPGLDGIECIYRFGWDELDGEGL